MYQIPKRYEPPLSALLFNTTARCALRGCERCLCAVRHWAKPALLTLGRKIA